MQLLARTGLSGRTAIAVLSAALALIALSWWLVDGRALGRAPAGLVADYVTGAVQRKGGDIDRRIETLQGRLRTAPSEWESYSQLGLAYLQKAREVGDPAYYQKAETVLRKALATEPNDYATLCAMGTLALARHQFASALSWGEHAREIDPQRAYAYGVITDALVELGRYDEAVAALQTMVDARPDLSSYARVSYLRELHGDVAGAVEMMQAAVESGGATAENTAWVRAQLADLHFNQGDLDQAELGYRSILERMPDYVYALTGLGRVLAARGRTDEAIKLLAQAEQTMPLPDTIITLGDVYAAAGDPKAARQQYDLMRVIQTLYEANGVDLDAEIALFDADHSDHPEKTVAQARQAFARRPSIYAADVLAWALYKASAYEEARSYAQQALRLGTRDALKLYHAGMIAYRLDRRDEARDSLGRALAINPYFSIPHASEARRVLAELNVP